MTISYIAPENINIQLFLEFDNYLIKDNDNDNDNDMAFRDRYIKWMSDYRVPNAESIMLLGGYAFDTKITFKEEKDLAFFLLTL